MAKDSLFDMFSDLGLYQSRAYDREIEALATIRGAEKSSDRRFFIVHSGMKVDVHGKEVSFLPVVLEPLVRAQLLSPSELSTVVCLLGDKRRVHLGWHYPLEGRLLKKVCGAPLWLLRHARVVAQVYVPQALIEELTSRLKAPRQRVNELVFAPNSLLAYRLGFVPAGGSDEEIRNLMVSAYGLYGIEIEDGDPRDVYRAAQGLPASTFGISDSEGLKEMIKALVQLGDKRRGQDLVRLDDVLCKHGGQVPQRCKPKGMELRRVADGARLYQEQRRAVGMVKDNPFDLFTAAVLWIKAGLRYGLIARWRRR